MAAGRGFPVTKGNGRLWPFSPGFFGFLTSGPRSETMSVRLSFQHVFHGGDYRGEEKNRVAFARSNAHFPLNRALLEKRLPLNGFSLVKAFDSNASADKIFATG